MWVVAVVQKAPVLAGEGETVGAEVRCGHAILALVVVVAVLLVLEETIVLSAHVVLAALAEHCMKELTRLVGVRYHHYVQPEKEFCFVLKAALHGIRGRSFFNLGEGWGESQLEHPENIKKKLLVMFRLCKYWYLRRCY